MQIIFKAGSYELIFNISDHSLYKENKLQEIQVTFK